MSYNDQPVGHLVKERHVTRFCHVTVFATTPGPYHPHLGSLQLSKVAAIIKTLNMYNKRSGSAN